MIWEYPYFWKYPSRKPRYDLTVEVVKVHHPWPFWLGSENLCASCCRVKRTRNSISAGTWHKTNAKTRSQLNLRCWVFLGWMYGTWRNYFFVFDEYVCLYRSDFCTSGFISCITWNMFVSQVPFCWMSHCRRLTLWVTRKGSCESV